MPPFLSRSGSDNDHPPPPSWTYIYIYISLIEAISSFERLCRLFIDAQGHSDHTVLMLQMTAIITLLYIKPNYEPEGSQIHTHMHTDVLYANINDLYLCYTKHLAI